MEEIPSVMNWPGAFLGVGISFAIAWAFVMIIRS